MEKLGFGKKTNCVNVEIRVQDGNKVTWKVLLREFFFYVNQGAQGVLTGTDVKFSRVTHKILLKKEHKGLKNKEAKEIDFQCR